MAVDKKIEESFININKKIEDRKQRLLNSQFLLPDDINKIGSDKENKWP